MSYTVKKYARNNFKNIIQHTLSVKKGIKKSLLVVDMPKGSYLNKKIAKKNAKFIMRFNRLRCSQNRK